MMMTQKNVGSGLGRTTWTPPHTSKLEESGKWKRFPSEPGYNRGHHWGQLPRSQGYTGLCPWWETKRPEHRNICHPSPIIPTPLSSQPALASVGLPQTWILATPCQSRGCLLRNEKKAPGMPGWTSAPHDQTWCHCLSGPVLSSNFFILPAPVL